MAEQVVAWTHTTPIFDTRNESNELRSRRRLWLLFSIVTYISYGIALYYHVLTANHKLSGWNITVIVMIGLTEIVLVILYVMKNLPEFKFRNTISQAIGKAICEFAGVYACYWILSQIHNHTRATCWIFVSLSAYSLALLRLISPTCDFSIPSLLAQVAMNESLHKETHRWDLTIKVGVICLLLIVLGGQQDVNWRQCTLYGEEEEGVINQWNPLPSLFHSIVLTDTLQIRRFFWAIISCLSILGFIVTFLCYVLGPANGNTFPYWIFIVVMVFMLVLEVLLVVYDRLPHLRFRNKAVKTVFKAVLDGLGVYGCLFLLSSIKNHIDGGACWMYFMLALDSLALFKIVSPSFDFSIPSILTQIAMNESLNNESNGHWWFTLIITFACAFVFAIQVLIEIAAVKLRENFMTVFGKPGNRIGAILRILPPNPIVHHQEMVEHGAG